MTDAPHPDLRRPRVRSDLVGYLIVSVADVGGLATVGEALRQLVDAGTLRILDLVALVCRDDGEVVVWESGSVPGLDLVVAPEDGLDLLSEHDIELSSLALRPGTAGVVVVTEDRWAEPLSTAAQRAGGQIVAGDRIPPGRIEVALLHREGEAGVG